MAEMSWEEAIVKVFKDNLSVELTNGDIAQSIMDKGYRTSVGKTPQNTVGARMSSLMDSHGIERLQRGIYVLRPSDDEASADPIEELDDLADDESSPSTIKIEAYGVHWERSKVHWQSGRILGYAIDPRETIDFAAQQGVYVLYDWNSVVYVGQTVAKDNGLLQRLDEHHTKRDDWGDRWERFSWFGIRLVKEDGELGEAPESANKRAVADLLESVLIETLRPAFNRQLRGNNMGNLYRQAIDPYFSINR